MGKEKALAGQGNKPTRGVYAIVNALIPKELNVAEGVVWAL